MSAIPEDFIKKTAELSEEVTRPFPNSTKVFVQGSRPDVRVPMREIAQAATSASFGEEENPPITVYDTSGPFTAPEKQIDLLKLNLRCFFVLLFKLISNQAQVISHLLFFVSLLQVIFYIAQFCF